MARICIVGGSLGGLLLANLLHRAGHEVRVLEKSKESLDGRGAGIVTHPNLLATLSAAGVAVDASLGVAVVRRVVLAQDGSVETEAAVPQLLTSWGRLYQLLLAALPAQVYLTGRQVHSVSHDADSTTAVCSNGERFEADLLIASDGIRSVVRGLFLPEAQPIYAGYVAWRGVVDEASLSSHTLDTIFDCFGFGLPPGEQLIGYPVAGQGNRTARGERRYNFVWYRPADAARLADLMTDKQGRHHALGIPPQLIQAQHVAQMRADAQALFAPQFAEMIAKTTQPFLQAIYDCTSERLSKRATCLRKCTTERRPTHRGAGPKTGRSHAIATTQQPTGDARDGQ
jgi:2-polyprenyl-6-methoxyphenol hydroxylase-like FAD-dependent oxidoreductase